MDSSHRSNNLNSFTQYSASPVSNIISIVGYLAVAFSLFTLAQKQSTPNAWFAFVPILQLVLLFQMVEMPVWYVALILIPCIGWIALWVFYMMAWMKLAERNGKPGFFGILCGVPLLGIIFPPIIAFT